MTTKQSGECGNCGRPLVLSTSNHNKGKPVRCLCERRRYHRDYGYAKRPNHRKRITVPWHESRGNKDTETNAQRRKKLRVQAEQWRSSNPDKVKDAVRKHTYGLEPGEYDRMLHEQRGNCKLCLKKMKRPHIDHCHKTGKVRGLLCGGCNMATGFIEGDPTWVDRALQYLKT